MNSGRIKYMLINLGLITSLLLLHVSACLCSTHVEKEAVESDCHTTSEIAQTRGTDDNAAFCDSGCVCAIDQSVQERASNSPSKEFGTIDNLAGPTQIQPEIEFVAVVETFPSASEFVNNLSYSSTLRSLLPSRAPPRL